MENVVSALRSIRLQHRRLCDARLCFVLCILSFFLSDVSIYFFTKCFSNNPTATQHLVNPHVYMPIRTQ